MTPPPSGACCVCGKETTKRCAACGKAGFSLYFCSKEHQELIWYAHKPFCGPNSKPFSFPPLSKEEAAEAKTILYERFMVLPSPPTSLAEVLNKLCLGSGHDLGCRMTNSLLADVLDRLQADTLPAMFSLWEKHRLLCHVRVALRAVTATFTSDKPVESNNTVRFNFSDAPAVFFLPLRATAKFAVRLAQGLKAALLEPYPVDDDWYIQLMHQAVVVSAFRQLQHAERLKAYNAADPKPCTHDELLHFSWPESFYAYDALLKSSADELVLQTNLLAKADEKKGKAALVAVESMLMGTMHKLEIEGGWARIVLVSSPVVG
ncbi:hypothetical protein JCM8097_003508 [Rhodosporidiobolus ruineniae]